MIEDYSDEGHEIDVNYLQIKMGKTLSQNFVDIMSRPILDYDDLLYVIKWFWDFELIPGIKEPGNAVNYMIGLSHPGVDDPLLQNYTPDEISSWLSNPENSSLVKSQFAMAYNKVMQKPLNDMQYSALSHNQKQYDWLNYEDLSDLFWVKHMVNPSGEAGVGAITALYGVQGSGKTDMSLSMWEHLKNIKDKTEKRLVTNIKIFDPGYEKTYVTTIGEMLRELFRNNIDGASTFLALDELTINGIRKKRTMAKETTNFDELDRGLRKFGADISYIWHFDTEIPSETYTRTSLLIHKLGSKSKPKLRSRAIITKKDDEYKKVYRIRGIKPTGLKFDSGMLAYLIMDVKFSELVDRSARLSKENLSNKERYTELLGIVENMLHQTQDDEVMPDDEQKNGMTIEEILKYVGISAPTFYKYLKMNAFIPTGSYRGVKTFTINPKFNINTRKFEEE